MMSLASVAAVLQRQRHPGAFQDISTHISSFLGPPSCLSLSQACSFGSTKLLDWIWNSSCTSVASRLSTWSVHNYLRSDPHYNRDQFVESLIAAVNRKDLAVVQWVFSHFSGLEVPEDVADAATRAGSLPVLKFLLANVVGHEGEYIRSKMKRKVGANDGEITAEEMESSKTRHLAHWDVGSMMRIAVQEGNPEVVRYLHENMPVYDTEQFIGSSLLGENDEVAQILMPKGKCLLDYASTFRSVKLGEMLLDCGYIQRDQGLAHSAIQILARFGRFDLMQQVVLVHFPFVKDRLSWWNAWRSAIKSACEHGNLSMLQWLLDHSIGQEHRGSWRRRRKKHSSLIWLAARNDHAEIMQYLYEQGAADELGDRRIVADYAAALNTAVVNDRYHAVKWMVEHVPFSNISQQGGMIIDTAVKHERFNILKLFHELSVTQNVENQAHQVAAWWSLSRNAMDLAAGTGRVDMFKWLLSSHPSNITQEAMNRAAHGGHLEMIQWLHANRSEGCTKKAMDDAAWYGHFDVVKWLHANRSEGCTTEAMDRAAGNGHLEIVKWLHANRSEGCTKTAMDEAARDGHLHVIKWLHANRPEGCSADAITNAMGEGHLAVLNWLHRQYPEHTPGATSEWIGKDNTFEILLFLHGHFPEMITPKIKADVDEIYYMDQAASAWLAINYPNL
ncbi:hypothetical protein F442_11859 [Phytophthora nicotianae P10297]|uniref:Uncharacterized protein n=1 Tax=Phytophthora nicotianae P10297 TaxID=1317064 RepID=W2Z0S3_PHYNI|nr:hypothetical protein F442_11859 [Phytophthora nicotianae P10297]